MAGPQERWPAATSQVIHLDGLPEQRKTVAGLAQQQDPELLVRYSSLNRLLRVTAWCRRRLAKRQSKIQGQASFDAKGDHATLSVREVEDAQRCWIQVVQATVYRSELVILQRGESLQKKNALTRLHPFLDERGFMRVGGRIKHSLLTYDEKHLIILPAHSHFTKLLIDSCHRRTLHGATDTRNAATPILGASRKGSGEALHTSVCYMRALAGGHTTAIDGGSATTENHTIETFPAHRSRLRRARNAAHHTRTGPQGV